MNKILQIVALNGLYDDYITTTKELSEKLDFSQQSTSRILLEMEKDELIEKKSSRNGTRIRLTAKGIEILQDEYVILKNVFNHKKSLKSNVVSGIGEGKFYVELYSDKIKKLLGYKPYPGTFNLESNVNEIKSFLHDKKVMTIEGFKDAKRTYGEVKVIPIMISEIECAILIPVRTNHPENILEVISSKSLKKELGKNNGDTIVIEQME